MEGLHQRKVDNDLKSSNVKNDEMENEEEKTIKTSFSIMDENFKDKGRKRKKD